MKEKIGMTLVMVGMFLLLGIAGQDDFQTMQGIYTPVLPLILKTLIPFGMLGMGVVILNGGAEQ